MDRTPRAAHLALALALLPPTLACRPRPAAASPAPAPEPTASAPAEPARPSRAPRGKQRPKPAADAESGRLAGITAAHNRVRERLGIAPLTWSPELARYAQRWADKLQKQGCKLRHRPRSGPDAQRHGENLFSMSGQTPTPDDVVDAWAAEVKDYNPKTAPVS